MSLMTRARPDLTGLRRIERQGLKESWLCEVATERHALPASGVCSLRGMSAGRSPHVLQAHCSRMWIRRSDMRN